MSRSFSVRATDGLARLARLETVHGTIETPAFMPVGTTGAVKGLTPESLAACGAEVMLSNLYHLALRPGVDTTEAWGGRQVATRTNSLGLRDVTTRTVPLRHEGPRRALLRCERGEVAHREHLLRAVEVALQARVLARRCRDGEGEDHRFNE